MDSGVEREPGLITTFCTPHFASSSKNAPKKRAVARGSATVIELPLSLRSWFAGWFAQRGTRR